MKAERGRPHVYMPILICFDLYYNYFKYYKTRCTIRINVLEGIFAISYKQLEFIINFPLYGEANYFTINFY